MTDSPNSTGPKLGVLLGLALPLIIGRATQAGVGLLDALMCAPLGEDALAAATTGANNVFGILMVPLGAVAIIQSFSSQLAGGGDTASAVRYAWYGLATAVAAGAACLLVIPFVAHALGLFGYSTGVRALMTDYTVIRLLSVAAIVGMEALGCWFSGLGRTRPAMVAGVITMVLVVFFNWVLIYGNLGAPKMGVAGAAWASVIGSVGGFVYLLVLFLSGRGLSVSIRPRGLRWREFARVTRYGLPHGVDWFFEEAAFILFINLIVADLGTTVLAALMVVHNINIVTSTPALAIASAGSILSGQAIGEGAKNRVPAIVWRTARATVGWQLVVCVVYLMFPDALLRGFAAPGQDTATEFIHTGAGLLMLSSTIVLAEAVILTFDETLRSAGDTAWVMWVRLTLAWLVFLPAAYVCVITLNGGYLVAQVCSLGYVVLFAALLVRRFRGGKWREFELVESEPDLVHPIEVGR